MRGQDMTRIETFVAAAFAFSVTMLVISLGSMPSTYAEFEHAIKQIPAFAASCAIIFWVWHTHASWCRRFGLEDGLTVVLSCLLIFIVLIYIYPLRLMMQGMFSMLSNGYFPFQISFDSTREVRVMFGFYAIGFMLLSLNFVCFFGHALRQSGRLQLSKAEKFKTKTDLYLWIATAAVCSFVLILVVAIPQRSLPFANFGYFLLGPVLGSIGWIRGKKFNQFIS